MKRQKNVSGYSLVEMLIVIFVFTILAIIITQALAVSLRGSKKSENISEVEANIENAVSIMERNLRSAEVDCTTSTEKLINYTDPFGNSANFQCDDSVPASAFIASSSARLTSTKVKITNCSIFTCNPSVSGEPVSVDINISAQDATVLGAEGSTIIIRTKILTRDY